jgi:hypothetical protein
VTCADDESARTLSVLLDGDETIVELADVATEQVAILFLRQFQSPGVATKFKKLRSTL